jgi:pimeloyl-ACP methyl ester carboxylesterase
MGRMLTALGLLPTLALLGAALPPPPGRLVDIGGRRLHLDCRGRGSPTVILEAGGGAFSIDWALTQPRVAAFTRVCSYDRAGYAWSDSGPADDRVEQVVSDLRRLLARAGVRPPYVIAGQSIGGIFARAYQRRYPLEIAGLVLVDSTHEDGVSIQSQGAQASLRSLTAEQLRLAETPSGPRPRPTPPTAVEEPYDRLPADLQQTRLALTAAYLEQGYAHRNDPPSAESSLESWRREFVALHDAAAADPHPLGGLPLIVISRGRRADFPEKRRQQLDLARLSRNSRFVVATESDHEVQLYQPDLVAEAIRDVVASARTGRPVGAGAPAGSAPPGRP